MKGGYDKMNEQEEKAQEKPADSAGNTQERISTRLPFLDEAQEERKRIEQTLKELREENNRREEMIVRQTLGGQTEGRIEIQPKVETAKEYAERVMKNKI